MSKWGVRFVGVFFILWAIHDFFGLLTGRFSKEGFMGIIVDAFGHDIAPWIGAFLCLYIGIQLIRLNPKGRRWALFLLWLWVIVSGFYLVWVALSPTSNFFSDVNMSIEWRFFYTNWPGEIKSPYNNYMMYIGLFLFYSDITYFLMRKGVKRLFEKPIPSEEPATILPGETS